MSTDGALIQNAIAMAVIEAQRQAREECAGLVDQLVAAFERSEDLEDAAILRDLAKRMRVGPTRPAPRKLPPVRRDDPLARDCT